MRTASLAAVLAIMAACGGTPAATPSPAVTLSSTPTSPPTPSVTQQVTPTAGPTPSEQPTPAPTAKPATPTPNPTPLTYVIRPGDSLPRIADMFGVTPGDLFDFNVAAGSHCFDTPQGPKPFATHIGCELILPPNAVAPGPTGAGTDSGRADRNATHRTADPVGEAGQHAVSIVLDSPPPTTTYQAAQHRVDDVSFWDATIAVLGAIKRAATDSPD